MHIILEVVTAPSHARKIVLSARQRATVGRTEWADFAFPHDAQMARIHFAIETTDAGCTIRDLGTSTGTFVNDQPIQQAILHDGDQIRAGQTVFLVSVEDGSGPPGERSREKRPRMGAALPGIASPAIAAPIAYRCDGCPSQVLTLRATAESPPVACVARRLAQKFPLYVILYSEKAASSLPVEESAPEYLMDWLPEAARAKYSPRIVSDAGQAFCLIEKYWGRDVLVAVFSPKPQAELFAQLRRAAGLFCRPSVLLPQIEGGPADYVAQLLPGIEAVLVENGCAWTVYALPDGSLGPSLKELGFVEQPAEVQGASS